MKPLIMQRADPQVYLHNDGWYYFTASVPGYEVIELRRAKSIQALADAPAKVVWRRHAAEEMSSNIWAPEIHYLDGKWYIYFAASDKGADENGVYDHRTYVLENASTNPLEGEFIEKAKLDTGWESFTLDATQFMCDETPYMVWAQRDMEIAGNSNLYIAKMQNPWTLTLPAAMLSRPELDWECQGFLVNEGPSVLEHNGKLFLTYSGSATDERYAMGMLTADKHSDLTDPKSWTKSIAPVMVSEPENEIFGPGHNSFTKNEKGEDILVFHARPYPGFRGSALSDPNRHTYIRTITYDAQDVPVFRQR